MPIYEYECKRCHQITEALQKFSDPPLKDCPYCKGKLKKLMSINSFHLKGSGWYVTDYAGKNAGSQSEKSSSEATVKEDNGSKKEKSESSTASPSESI